MDHKQFQELLNSLDRLSLDQRHMLNEALQVAPEPDKALDLINDRALKSHICPYCQSANAWRWGFKSGVQRFRCKDCRRTYNALTGTQLARLKRRDAWLAYNEAMIQGQSIRKAAKSAHVHPKTSFRWRHRMLTAPSQVRDVEMDGIVEADDTYFLESFKGSRNMPRPARKRGGKASKRGLSKEQIPVLVVRDRRGRHFDQVLSAVNQSTLGTILPQLLSDESILCTDGAHAYKSVAKSFGIPHESLRFAKHGHVKDRVFHIQHVNAYDSRLKLWMQPFKGELPRLASHDRAVGRHADSHPSPDYGPGVNPTLKANRALSKRQVFRRNEVFSTYFLITCGPSGFPTTD
jgi:transposase-like protein